MNRKNHCSECERYVPPDEQQVVDDIVNSKIRKAAGKRIPEGQFSFATAGGGLCSECFHRLDADEPLDQFIETFIQHSLLHNPQLFVWEELTEQGGVKTW